MVNQFLTELDGVSGLNGGFGTRGGWATTGVALGPALKAGLVAGFLMGKCVCCC